MLVLLRTDLGPVQSPSVHAAGGTPAWILCGSSLFFSSSHSRTMFPFPLPLRVCETALGSPILFLALHLLAFLFQSLYFISASVSIRLDSLLNTEEVITARASLAPCPTLFGRLPILLLVRQSHGDGINV